MRRKAVFGTMLVLLLLGILPSVLNIKSAKAATSPYSPAGGIKLNPPLVKYTATVECQYNGTTFDVEVIVSNITGCGAYQFRIDYNSTLLALDSWTFDTWPDLPLSPAQMAPAPADRVDTDVSVPGSVRVSTFWKPATPPYTYSGDSVAAQLTFKIIYCPPYPMWPQENNTVSTPIAFYNNQTLAYDKADNEILFTNFSDGYYEYTTKTHTSPSLFVVVAADPSTLSSGESSTITVNVTDSLSNPVSSAEVFLSSDKGGTFSPSSGFADSNGIFTSTFTAPSVTVQTTFTITADAFQGMVGGENQTHVTVNPPSVVGGIYIPTNKTELLTPYVGLATMLAVAVATVVYAKKRKSS